MGFERTIPAFERAKTIHALDRAATVIGKDFRGVCRKVFQDPTYYSGANLDRLKKTCQNNR
jgi:hypothetical protein